MVSHHKAGHQHQWIKLKQLIKEFNFLSWNLVFRIRDANGYLLIRVLLYSYLYLNYLFKVYALLIGYGNWIYIYIYIHTRAGAGVLCIYLSWIWIIFWSNLIIFIFYYYLSIKNFENLYPISKNDYPGKKPFIQISWDRYISITF